MILLCKEGAHGVSARREKVCMSLPQKGKGRTIKSHVPLGFKLSKPCEPGAYGQHQQNGPWQSATGYAAILLGSVRCDISNVRYSSYSILIAAVVRFRK